MPSLTLINMALSGIDILSGAIPDGDSTNVKLSVFNLLTFMTNTMAFNHVVLDHETIPF